MAPGAGLCRHGRGARRGPGVPAAADCQEEKDWQESEEQDKIKILKRRNEKVFKVFLTDVKVSIFYFNQNSSKKMLEQIFGRISEKIVERTVCRNHDWSKEGR